MGGLGFGAYKRGRATFSVTVVRQGASARQRRERTRRLQEENRRQFEVVGHNEVRQRVCGRRAQWLDGCEVRRQWLSEARG
jgi:hypothetical protein